MTPYQTFVDIELKDFAHTGAATKAAWNASLTVIEKHLHIIFYATKGSVGIEELLDLISTLKEKEQ